MPTRQSKIRQMAKKYLPMGTKNADGIVGVFLLFIHSKRTGLRAPAVFIADFFP